MATYPQVIGATIGANRAKQHRMNKIYGTAISAGTAVKPVRKYQTKGPNMFKRMIKSLVTWSMTENHRHQEDIVVSESDTCRISSTGIRFEVYRANGGNTVTGRYPASVLMLPYLCLDYLPDTHTNKPVAFDS